MGDTWYLFAVEKEELIRRVFRKVGLSLAADGSEDDQLDIKGFKDLVIGDWKLPVTATSDFADVDRVLDEDDSIEFLASGE